MKDERDHVEIWAEICVLVSGNTSDCSWRKSGSANKWVCWCLEGSEDNWQQCLKRGDLALLQAVLLEAPVPLWRQWLSAGSLTAARSCSLPLWLPWLTQDTNTANDEIPRLKSWVQAWQNLQYNYDVKCTFKYFCISDFERREIGKYHHLGLGCCYLNHTIFVQLSALPQNLQKLSSLVAFVLLPCEVVERSDNI